MQWIPLVAGGVAGTVSRYLVTGWMTRAFGSQFPYGTLTVNLLGCFLLGFFAIVSETRFPLNPHTKLLLLVGFCGAFTTFSTWILDTATLMKDGQMMAAAGNVAFSLVLGFVALRLGVLAGNWLA